MSNEKRLWKEQERWIVKVHKDDVAFPSFFTVSAPPIKRTLSIKQALSRVPKLTCYISLYNEPLFSRHLY